MTEKKPVNIAGALIAAMNNITEAIRITKDKDVKQRLQLALRQLVSIANYYKIEDEPYPSGDEQ